MKKQIISLAIAVSIMVLLVTAYFIFESIMIISNLKWSVSAEELYTLTGYVTEEGVRNYLIGLKVWLGLTIVALAGLAWLHFHYNKPMPDFLSPKEYQQVIQDIYRLQNKRMWINLTIEEEEELACLHEVASTYENAVA